MVLQSFIMIVYITNKKADSHCVTELSFPPVCVELRTSISSGTQQQFSKQFPFQTSKYLTIV